MSAQIPKQLIAGDTWSWVCSLADYPAPTWGLTYFFVKSGDRFEVASSASGSDHSIAVTAATTGALKPGRYRWTARVSSGANTTTVDQGWVEVTPNPASGAADPRSWAARTLAAIEAFLEGNATTAQASMTINDRSISRWSLPELTQWRDRLRAEVRTEEQGSRAGLGRMIKVRYGRS